MSITTTRECSPNSITVIELSIQQPLSSAPLWCLHWPITTRLWLRLNPSALVSWCRIRVKLLKQPSRMRQTWCCPIRSSLQEVETWSTWSHGVYGDVQHHSVSSHANLWFVKVRRKQVSGSLVSSTGSIAEADGSSAFNKASQCQQTRIRFDAVIQR